MSNLKNDNILPSPEESARAGYYTSVWLSDFKVKLTEEIKATELTGNQDILRDLLNQVYIAQERFRMRGELDIRRERELAGKSEYSA